MSSHSAQRHRVLLLFMAAVKHPIIERDSVNSVSATADVARYPWPGPRMFLQHRCGASAQGSTCPIAHSCDSPQFINSSDNLIRLHRCRRQLVAAEQAPTGADDFDWAFTNHNVTKCLYPEAIKHLIIGQDSESLFLHAVAMQITLQSSSTAALISCGVRSGCELRETVH